MHGSRKCGYLIYPMIPDIPQSEWFRTPNSGLQDQVCQVSSNTYLLYLGLIRLLRMSWYPDTCALATLICFNSNLIRLAPENVSVPDIPELIPSESKCSGHPTPGPGLPAHISQPGLPPSFSASQSLFASQHERTCSRPPLPRRHAQLHLSQPDIELSVWPDIVLLSQ